MKLLDIWIYYRYIKIKCTLDRKCKELLWFPALSTLSAPRAIPASPLSCM